MENVFPSSDSVLENTSLYESVSSPKDIALTKNTSHNLTSNDANVSFSGSLAFKNNIKFPVSTNKVALSATFSDKDHNTQKPIEPLKPKVVVSSVQKSSEKQCKNEQYITLQSSLSSETDSWECMFPPLSEETKFFGKFPNDEHCCLDKEREASRNSENVFPDFDQKTTFESTSYFIDAASLVDEEYDTKIQAHLINADKSIKTDKLLTTCQSVPCTSVDFDASPNDFSENEYSIEQTDSIGSDSLQKNTSSEIFPMTPTTKGYSYSNAFKSSRQSGYVFNNAVELDETFSYESEKEASLSPTTVVVSRTPNSSMTVLNNPPLKHYDSDETKSVAIQIARENHSQLKLKYNESSPIISGGASIEDHLPQIDRFVGSPLTRQKKEGIPIESGAYKHEDEKINTGKCPKMSCASSWVVDMSSSPTSFEETSDINSKVRSVDRSYNDVMPCSSNRLENGNNLENLVDSDSSGKSSRDKFSKFYIDLSTVSDSEAPKKNNDTDSCEKKKNIFCMYIDLDEKATLKEMPVRLSSSLNMKKSSTTKPKVVVKNKTIKDTSNKSAALSFPKNGKPNNYPSTIGRHESLSNVNSFPGQHTGVYKSDSDVESVENTTRSMDAVKPYNQYHNTAAVIQVESIKEQSINSFVKLSDLDKPVRKSDKNTNTQNSNNKKFGVGMTRSIPDYNWGDQSSSATLRSTIEVISSFHSENALSLNRLFPHLKNEFSRSMPGSLSDRTRSPLRLAVTSISGDMDAQSSEMSETSSVQSSLCVSVIENSTTEETSQTSKLIGNCQSRLGRDLLRMFLEEVAPDVIVEVSGRRIKAHKCILSSRCQYFAGILSGGWVESAGNVIVLPPFSFNTVHFALCHIYSGISSIPESSSIVELATIADMLGLEGLKEAIMLTLRVKYCHHFHRPCPVCTAGVLECFPLSSVYGLDDLYRKCLRWITKYFHKVWPTKAFATLPKELQDKCYQQHIINMTVDNVVATVYGCGITVASLQNNRWSEVVARLCRRLVRAAAQCAAAQLAGALRGVAPLPADAPRAARRALDECLAAAFDWAAPDELCRAYALLSALVKEIRTQNNARLASSLLHAHAGGWRAQCEGALVRAAPRVVATQAFVDLPADLRKRLRKLGCIEPIPVTSPIQNIKCRHVEVCRAHSSSSRSLDIDDVRSSFVPYAPKLCTPLTSVEILKSSNDIKYRKSNRLTPPMVRTTKAQEERAKFNLSKTTQPQERPTNQSATTRVTSFRNTKPRYLEPKTYNNEKKLPAGKKLAPNTTSLSDSSRNSSPVQVRSWRSSCPAGEVRARGDGTARSGAAAGAASRPGTADPSTDSLSDSQNSNKYATYTKSRHTTKGSIECTKSPKSQVAPQSAVAANNKLKTKIPIYINDIRKCTYVTATSVSGSQGRSTRSLAPSANSGSPNVQSRNRGSERGVQSATIASSNKTLPKTTKASHYIKNTPKQPQRASPANKDEKPPVLSAMERSGTFLKDEPSFGDKTTNIDEVLG